jgi:hypothetical protein
MSRVATLRRHKTEAFNSVARTRFGMKCGVSPRGSKPRVCLSVAPVPGMKCGRNPVNGLYACASKGNGSSSKRRGKKRARGRR